MDENFDPQSSLLSRRHFIRQASCAAIGSGALMSAIWDLRRVNAAALGGNDYGALVCVFLNGGNDCNNTIIPYETADYDAYAAVRGVGLGGLSIPFADLRMVQPQNAGSPRYGFHPSMLEMQQLFNSNRLAVLCNTGTLVVPTTRDQFKKRQVPLPKQLYSHNDQQVQWQTSIAAGPTDTGWGGRVADIINSLNTNPKVSMSISLAGVNTFEVGKNVAQYHVTSSGTVSLSNVSGFTSVQTNAVESLLAQPHDNLYEVAYRDIFRRALDSDAVIRASLASSNLMTTFPDVSLGRQLRMVARLIEARNTLNMRRQVFFCEVGGYDNHDEQLVPHARLLQELSQSLGAFDTAMQEIGISDKVTLFTCSDFGRGYPPNGDGTDHAWGGHHFILGGGVRGGHFYGQYPELRIDGPNDAFRGSWIPTTSVDQYSATLARWFGVSETDLDSIFPNLKNFATRDVGFML